MSDEADNRKTGLVPSSTERTVTPVFDPGDAIAALTHVSEKAIESDARKHIAELDDARSARHTAYKAYLRELEHIDRAAAREDAHRTRVFFAAVGFLFCVGAVDVWLLTIREFAAAAGLTTIVVATVGAAFGGWGYAKGKAVAPAPHKPPPDEDDDLRPGHQRGRPAVLRARPTDHLVLAVDDDRGEVAAPCPAHEAAVRIAGVVHLEPRQPELGRSRARWRR